jgi:hypothetical protein
LSSARAAMTELILLRLEKIGAGSRLDVMCVPSVSSRVGARSQGGNPIGGTPAVVASAP